MGKATFVHEKDCKHSIRFTEEVPDKFTTAMVGTIYVKKDYLANIGYTDGDKLVVTVEVE